jgi:hypothetical protein
MLLPELQQLMLLRRLLELFYRACLKLYPVACEQYEAIFLFMVAMVDIRLFLCMHVGFLCLNDELKVCMAEACV